MRTLEVDALAGGIRRNEDLNLLVLRERLLRFPPILAPHAAVDRHDGFRPTDERASPVRKVVQSIPVLGEHDELTSMPVGVEHLRVLLEQLRELLPLLVRPTTTHAER